MPDREALTCAPDKQLAEKELKFGQFEYIGVGYDLEQRSDDLPGFSAAYGLHCNGASRTKDLDLHYRALNAR